MPSPRALLKSTLYRALGDDGYAMLRVPSYAGRLARTARALRRGGPAAYEAREFACILSRLGTLERFVDVGAYLGDYAIPIALLAPRAEVIAVEPMPSTYGALRVLTGLFRTKNVELHNIAAGSAPGRAELAVDIIDGAPSPMGASLGQSIAASPVRRRFSVDLASIDSILKGRRADFIKIDVEGHEEEVLRGMRGALESTPPVLCELWRASPEDLARRERIFAWMGQIGYQAHFLGDGGIPIAVTSTSLAENDRRHSLYSNYLFLAHTQSA